MAPHGGSPLRSLPHPVTRAVVVAQDGWSQGMPLALGTLFIPVPLAVVHFLEVRSSPLSISAPGATHVPCVSHDWPRDVPRFISQVATAFWTLYIHTDVGGDGLTLPWPLMGCDYHYYHHKYNWYNFGFMTVLFDTMFGTVKHPGPDRARWKAKLLAKAAEKAEAEAKAAAAKAADAVETESIRRHSAKAAQAACAAVTASAAQISGVKAAGGKAD